MIRNIVLALAALAPSLAAAQVVFEPVRYQYHGDRSTFYYGGSDPAVIAYGLGVDALQPQCSPAADECTHPAVANRVYSDAMPLNNAGIYGWSPSDARKEARANLPRFFVKRDLLPRDAGRGLITVPAQAQPVRIEPAVRVAPKPAARQPAPILIIPKDKLRKPAAPVKQAMFVAVTP